jgi:hypothetical protein
MEEETQMRLAEEDQFSNSDIANQALAHAGKKRSERPPMAHVDLTGSATSETADTSNMLNMLDPRDMHKRTRFEEDFVSHPQKLPPAPATVPAINPPAASTSTPMQYIPGVARLGTGQRSFGRAVQDDLLPFAAFNPFASADKPASTPRYLSLHSPDKPSLSTPGTPSTGPIADARRSLRALLETSDSESHSSSWTFKDVHSGSKSIRAHAQLSCLLAIHDVQWQGYINNTQVVPEEWKIFPGPLYGQFRQCFFHPSSSTRDAIDWLQSKYRHDLQERLLDRRLRPRIEDPFWSKALFDAFRQGDCGFLHPMQQSDIAPDAAKRY